MTRQRVLAREDRSQLRVILNESVIRRVIGGPEEMRAQLEYLIAAGEQGRTPTNRCCTQTRSITCVQSRSAPATRKLCFAQRPML